MFSSDNPETVKTESDASSTISSESGSIGCVNNANLAKRKTTQNNSSGSSQWTLLDLYSGCGAMSTGLCLGASLAGIKLVTVCRAVLLSILVFSCYFEQFIMIFFFIISKRWAVDINAHACESLKLNHPETQVRFC